MSILYILIAILLLGILVIVHEFGHFIVARWCGIQVKEFSIGFGPQIISWKGKKHETKFKWCIIPFGGYCMFYEETASDPDAIKTSGDEEKKEDPRAYYKQAVWKRILSVIAGPAFNMLLAFLVALLLVGVYGNVVSGIKVNKVDEASPAYTAGMLENDELVSIDGISVNNGDLDGVSVAMQQVEEPGKELTVVVKRDGVEKELTMLPQYNEEEDRYVMGIIISPILDKTPTAQIIPDAFNYCVNASTMILGAFKDLVTTGKGFDETSGPVGVVQVISEMTQQGGFSMFLYLAIIISINLGIFNILPIPGLDGARLIFMIIEAIRRKPVNQKIETIVHFTGYVFLFGLLIYFTFRDVWRIII